MKTKVIFLLTLLSFSVSNAQVTDLTGTWNMFEMTYVTPDGNQVMSEEQMKTNGSVTDYFLMAESKFKMTSNMSGSGTLDTYEGTWKLSGDQLMFTLKIGDRMMDIVWKAEFRDNALNLSRTSPDGSLTIINTFRKK